MIRMHIIFATSSGKLQDSSVRWYKVHQSSLTNIARGFAGLSLITIKVI